MIKKFLSNKKPGFYVSFVAFVLALLTLILYTARGGNYLSPVSSTAVILLVLGIVANLFVLVLDFQILGIIPVILYSCVFAVLLNTERLFITNVFFGVDGNSFSFAYYLIWIFLVLSILSSAVSFSLGRSKTNRLLPKEN